MCTGALGTIAWTVFVEGPVITVYFPSIIVLAAAQVLGATTALFWGAVSIALIGAGVLYPPPPRPPASPLFTSPSRHAPVR